MNWKNDVAVIIVPSVKDDEAKQLFPNGFKTIKPYLRVVAQPKGWCGRCRSPTSRNDQEQLPAVALAVPLRMCPDRCRSQFRS